MNNFLRTALLIIGLCGAARAFDGQLIDAASNAPIADGAVVLGGLRVLADATGHFHLDPAAGHAFARAPG